MTTPRFDLSEALSAIELEMEGVQSPEREASATQSGVAVSRFVEGLTDEGELRGELQALGYTGQRQDRLVLAAQLRRQLDLYKDRLAIWRQQFKDGQLTQSEFATLIEGAGAGPDTLALELQRAAPQKPKAVIQSVLVGLSVLSAEELEARPAAQPVMITLGVLAAGEIAAPVEAVERVQVSLNVLQAAEVPRPPALEPVLVTLAILEVEEA